jgi:hypothetical protein
MQNKEFIDVLSYSNSNYNNPEQAITTANLCETISRDINTDSQRFIYELLQNADDASSESGMLDVRVDFIGDYVVVSHKGETFSKIDIESISSAGDGTKAGDSTKTGFKGIGFKSVFSHSNFVIIKSGNFCFKFDKEYWVNHWNNVWGSQSRWKTERRSKGKDENLKMPWQIIPIWTDLPNELKELSVFQEYNVSIIIRYDKIEQLKRALNDLFSESQIVLFLRSKQVKVSINATQRLLLEKNVNEETTILQKNGVALSEWLIKIDQFDIPADVQREINADDKSPKKLKEAQRTEISYAIQLEKGRLKAVDKEKRLIFTYLPTSINYDFPFLVNASFLTDAGRQHLHQDTFWNNWLFKQIPVKFFSWVAELAHNNSKYNKQFLAIVPHRLGDSSLESSFNEGFNSALQTIAFVPNLKGDLLKVKESVFDKTNISQFINPQTIINYINESRNKNFSVSSYTPYLEPLSTLGRLGAEMFDIDDLEGFFASSIFAKEHKLSENFNLISFLHEQAQRSKGDDNRNVWNEILRQTPFIFDESEKLKKPSHIYFPAVEFSNEFSNDISIIHESIVSKINANSRIKTWLEYLGVKEPSDLSFIEKTIIEQGETFVTNENAIEIGRYLFNAHKKGVLQDNHYENLQNLKVLTKQNSLISASKSFLSDFYEPDLRIESVYDSDIFVSEKYFENKDLKSEWKTFFIKVGVKNQLQWESFTISKSECKNRRDFGYFEPIISLMDGKSKYSNYGQYSYSINGFTLHHFSFIDYVNNYHFAKIYWENVFEFDFQENNYDRINGSSGFWAIFHGVVETANQKRYFAWTIENLALFPTKNGQLKKANEVLINSPENIEIASKYLPVLDYSGVLPENWLRILPIKQTLDLDDLLKVLELIWKQSNSDEILLKEDQKIISKIYERLSTNYLGYSGNLRNWAISNKLLAKNGKDFYYPKELSIVTVEGFSASHLAFAEKQSPEIIELLRLFGVQIIDKVNATISNSKVEITDLKTKLLQTSPLIALVAVEKSKNRKEWENEYERIKQKLLAIYFFETTQIYLSYGNEDDQQKRSSWAENDNFYYVGNWYSPRVLDGLVEPLGNFLKIRYAERILTVLLLETFADGLEYLKEKGFDISLIPDEFLNSKEPENRGINQGNRAYNQSDEDLGKQGELVVFEKLKQKYSLKYSQGVEETLTGFKVGEKVEVFWRNKNHTTTANHDFKVVELGEEIYIDSKATPYGKNIEKVPLYISGSELDLMETAEKYLIARVYNATSGTNVEVEFVRLQIDSP